MCRRFHLGASGVDRRLIAEEVFIRAGFVDAKGRALYSLKDLRRTAITLARMSGQAEDVIRDQMGHHDYGVTRKHYDRTRMNPRLHEFAEAWDQMMGGDVEPVEGQGTQGLSGRR